MEIQKYPLIIAHTHVHAGDEKYPVNKKLYIFKTTVRK